MTGPVARDHPRRGAQYMPGRAIVSLQPDHLGAGEVLLEAQDVADFGPAPAVDRLVVVADTGDVLVAACEQAQPEILGDVGVLIFVDEDGAEPPLVLCQHVRVAREQGQPMEEQVAEVAGVQGRQPLLVGGIELDPLAQREVAGLRRRHLIVAIAAILPALDGADQKPRWPAPLVEFGRLDDLLGQPLLVVAVEDGEAGLQAEQLGVRPDHPCAHGMEGAEPHAGYAAIDEAFHPLAHLPGGPVGEA